MDNSYFYIILRFRRLSDASSSRAIRTISGDDEVIRYAQTEKDMCTFFIFGCLLYARATLYARALCGPT